MACGYSMGAVHTKQTANTTRARRQSPESVTWLILTRLFGRAACQVMCLELIVPWLMCLSKLPPLDIMLKEHCHFFVVLSAHRVTLWGGL